MTNYRMTPAEAAYATWQREVKIQPEPLGEQSPAVQARWLKVAEAARSTPPTNHGNENDRAAHPTMTPFQAPPDDALEAAP